MAKLIFLSNDLFFAGRVRAACQLKNLEFVFSGKLPEAEQPGEVAIVAVDLSAPGNMASEIVPAARQSFPDATLIAYAPHVHKEDLANAEAAGFDTVMSRGQFNHWLQKSEA